MNRQQRRAALRAQTKANESYFQKNMMNMDEHTRQLLASGKVIGGSELYAVPPAVIPQDGPDGIRRNYAYPQVAVALINDTLIAQIALVAAIQTKKAIFEELEKRGIIPPLDIQPDQTTPAEEIVADGVTMVTPMTREELDRVAAERVQSDQTGVPTSEEES